MSKVYETPYIEMIMIWTEDILTLSNGGTYDDSSNSISWDELIL